VGTPPAYPRQKHGSGRAVCLSRHNGHAAPEIFCGRAQKRGRAHFFAEQASMPSPTNLLDEIIKHAESLQKNAIQSRVVMWAQTVKHSNKNIDEMLPTIEAAHDVAFMFNFESVDSEALISFMAEATDSGAFVTKRYEEVTKDRKDPKPDLMITTKTLMNIESPIATLEILARFYSLFSRDLLLSKKSFRKTGLCVLRDDVHRKYGVPLLCFISQRSKGGACDSTVFKKMFASEKAASSMLTFFQDLLEVCPAAYKRKIEAVVTRDKELFGLEESDDDFVDMEEMEASSCESSPPPANPVQPDESEDLSDFDPPPKRARVNKPAPAAPKLGHARARDDAEDSAVEHPPKRARSEASKCYNEYEQQSVAAIVHVLATCAGPLPDPEAILEHVQARKEKMRKITRNKIVNAYKTFYSIIGPISRKSSAAEPAAEPAAGGFKFKIGDVTVTLTH